MTAPPPIDRRSFGDLVAQTEQLLQRYSDWQRVAPLPELLLGRTLNEDVVDHASGELVAANGTVVDPELAQRIGQVQGLDRVRLVPLPGNGWALVRIFARMTELVLDRLNQVPDKNFLAFLDLVGLELLPPQAARVPLTFHLAAGSTVDALAPARTQVSAIPVEGEAAPVTFETEQELVVTWSRLVAAHTREPSRDRHSDHTADVTGAGGAAFPVFQGDQPIGHHLYLAHGDLFGIEGAKTVTLRLGPAEGAEAWPAAVAWTFWDGTTWRDAPATVSPAPVGGAWEVVLPDLPTVPGTAVGGRAGSWLRGRLATTLPQGDPPAATGSLRQDQLVPDGGFTDGAPLAFDQTVFPFGRLAPRPACYLACDAAFSKPDGQVAIGVELDPAHPARPSADLELAWEFWDGGTWLELGRSSPSSSSTAPSRFDLLDHTQAFTRAATISFRCPASWAAAPVNGVTHFWLRVRTTSGQYGTAGRYRPPALRRLEIGYTWPLPRIDAVGVSASLRRGGLLPEAALASQGPVDPASQFLPFGEKPRFNDALYLAVGGAVARAGSLVTLDVAVGNPRRPQAAWPLPPVRPSPGLTVAWEHWDGSQWAVLGSGGPLPADRLLEPFATPFQGRALTLTGERPPDADVEVEELHTGAQHPGVRQLDGRWEATLDDLSPGVHALRVTARPPGAPAERLWAVAVTAAPETAPVTLGLAPVPGSTAEPRVVVRGAAPIDSGRVLLHNAATDAPTDTAFSQRFRVEVELAPGRNDLLVLVFDAAERPVAGEVLSVVRTEAPVPNDFDDTTWGLTRSGQVSFRLPSTTEPREVAGQAGRWVRARIVAGDYGVDARYEPVTDPSSGQVVVDPTTGAPVYQLVPATFRPPLVGPVGLGYDYTSPLTLPDAVLTENDFVLQDRSETAAGGGQRFSPYTPTLDTRPALYLGFQRPGAATGFANRSTALYFEVAQVPYGRPGGQEGVPADPPAVVWEYWNGGRWAQLGTRDETRGFTRRGLVKFIAPADFRSSTEFGQSAFWLRARWDRGSYGSPPQLRRVLTNTTWATHTLTVEEEVLGSSNGEPNQVFRTAKVPVLPDQQVEVREPELPSAAERAVIEAEEGEGAITVVRDPGGNPIEVWVRWHAVGDFYESAPRSRHYTLDRLAGSVRFGDGRRGLLPPRGRANVRAAWYQAGGGPDGNRPAGTIAQLKTAVPYVDGVTNWEASSGGAAQETLDAVKARGPRTLRHRDRAVAISDFEDLAMQASPEVARVKGIPARTSADAGRVILIVLPRSSAAQPVPDLELLGRVADHIEGRRSPAVDLRVLGPVWLRVEVAAELVPVSLDAATDVQAAVLARLAAFLHPLSGGLDGQGWEFGRRPHRSDCYALIESVPGVDHVRRLTIAAEVEAGDPQQDAFLVYSGIHQIDVVGEPGAEDGAAPS